MVNCVNKLARKYHHKHHHSRKEPQDQSQMASSILYKNHKSVKIGEANRFIIEYTPSSDRLSPENTLPSSLFLKFKNLESLPLRAAYLLGPYILYVDIRTSDFDHNKKCFITADQPLFQPNLQAGQSFEAELSLHTIKSKYVWVVDVMSQLLFNTSTEVNFEILIGTDKKSLHDHEHHLLESKNFNPVELNVIYQDAIDLWNKPVPNMAKPAHLVMLTHGFYSNVGADMLYIKEAINKMAAKTGENVIVKGYNGNVCKTEKGIKYLGTRVAEYIVEEVYKNYPNINKISFIGHSLGGLIQTFAIAYITVTYPSFFEEVIPENFVTLASPLLGIANENPAYVKMALSVGIVGKTGQDLGLQGSHPLLLKLPTGPAHDILKRFKNRTLYANVLHDGIVPLRTSALLYLDWKGLTEVTNARKKDSQTNHDSKNIENGTNNNSAKSTEAASDGVSEIPETPYIQNSSGSPTEFFQDVSSKVLSPFQSILALCAPMAQPKPANRYKRFQTVTNKEEGEDANGEELASFDTNEDLKPIPKSSVIQSAARVLLPPLPPLKFIVDPSSRENVILHDRVYTEDDLPKNNLHNSNTTFLTTLVDPNIKFHLLEEKIARLWHKELSWRKVLVNLQPDAHNNITVRRRFANAYGWQVIDHMVENHFGYQKEENQDIARGNSIDFVTGSEKQPVEEQDLGWILKDDDRNDDDDNQKDNNNTEVNGNEIQELNNMMKEMYSRI
ncbi:hypothetical protein PACTADRAFT_48678 [Pachysolen tannophilus NRRL Y-2460]|uniref:DUF676 domain-containing protein n=1 Tax=Pachysolen tannophilus NRRL Y-2460 TaxID=669874 RepID=A0A1E4TYS1_PACTA|nr:hypothetical protein PACTADRAFT_48678 [Pachysolen tannophilus NRRL Y-2460]